MTATETHPRPSRLDVLAHARAWLSDRGEHGMAQRAAGTAFAIRVANAALLYLTQVLLARWMGRYEFGVYAYVWTFIGLVSALAPLGVAVSGSRFVAEYRTQGDEAGLRGFIFGARWMCVGLGATAAAILVTAVIAWQARITPAYVPPILVACAVIPIFALSSAQDTIARAFNWFDLALIPAYVVLPVFILTGIVVLHFAGIAVTATLAVAIAAIGLWTITLAQSLLLNRRLKTPVAPGPRRVEPRRWLATALPIYMNESCYLILTYADILILQMFVEPADLGVYFAATKTLAVVIFVYYAVGAASAHRFSEFHVAGDREKLAAFVRETVRWTFYPSLAIALALVAVGKPLLSLFGPGFEQGYPILCIVALGVLARASLGPAERLLNMVGEQRGCLLVYASALATNVALCFLLIPRFGIMGAALAVTTAILVESILLFLVTRSRLGLNIFVFAPAPR